MPRVRLTPPLPAIEAFLITVQSDSLRDAARRLSLSPSALSRRIRTLEAYLGKDLFERGKTGFPLTPAGTAYLADIREPIEKLRLSTETARGRKPARTVRLMASHSLSTGWLNKRLIRFEKDNPDLEIDLIVGHSLSEFKRSGADIGFLSDTWPLDGLIFTPVIAINAMAVSAPQMADGSVAPSTLATIHAAPRVIVKDPEDLWQKWWRGAGGSPELEHEPKTYQTIMLALEAATTGSGVTLGVAPHVTRYLNAGSLVKCSDTIVPFGRQYGIVWREGDKPGTPQLKRVEAWLHSEGRAAEQEFSQFS